MLAAGGSAGAEATAAARREGLRALAQMADRPGRAPVRRLEAPGPGGAVGLDLYAPAEASDGPQPALVFLHGGGWVAGGAETHGGLCGRLAEAARLTVVAVDYRLAPEHPFPAAFDDALAAVRWVGDKAAELGIDPDRLAIGGDSAGGGLAAAASAALRDQGGPMIAAQLLICPILDLAEESESRRALSEGFFLSRATMDRDVDAYCPPPLDRRDPRLSPLQAASFEGLPPTLLHTAEFDPFRDEGTAYAGRLKGAGVKVEETCHAGMIHYFYALAQAIPYGEAAATAIGAQLRGLIG